MPTAADLRCGDCGDTMELRRAAFGWFYGCVNYPVCKGIVSAHQETKEPMGTPANAETRLARIRAHAAFDTLWRGGPLTRKEAYRWLRKVMQKSYEDGHIGHFTLTECEALIEAVKKLKDGG